MNAQSMRALILQLDEARRASYRASLGDGPNATITDLDRRILTYPCQTIEEVRAVAAHLRSEFGNQLSAMAANRFIAGLVKSREQT